jgi:DNA-directed RNA polymerase subunit N (RpoN/RPB10)
MLFAVKCTGCSELLSQNIEGYFNDYQNILNDPKLKKKDKEIARSKLLDKYGYKNICCRIKILGTIPFHDIISK